MQTLETVRTDAGGSMNGLRQLVLPHGGKVRSMVARLSALRTSIAVEPGEKVLCHGDVWGRLL